VFEKVEQHFGPAASVLDQQHFSQACEEFRVRRRWESKRRSGGP
jgi:hypothetical protein